MATVMRVAGDKEGDGEGRKGNGDGDKVRRSKIVRTIRIFEDRSAPSTVMPFEHT